MEKWYVMTKRADFDAISRRFNIDPVTARILRNRDLTTEEEIRKYLYGSADDLYDPKLLKDVEKAAVILRDKIRQGKKIRIISDYDVDGISANYILSKGLKRCGARVDHRVPDRMTDGYGVNVNLIDRACEDHIDTVITCDNGIAAFEAVERARSLSMTMIVTDHHEVPFSLNEAGEKEYKIPDAEAVIDPKQADCNYPFPDICGAVVAWKLICVLYEIMGIPAAEAEGFLEICALATVCDVMPLKDENRIIVREGLKKMQDTSITGLKALIEACGLSGRKITAYHLGFVIGPSLNASGRLSTAEKAVSLLLTGDAEKAALLAPELRSLNEERKEMTVEGEKEAVAYLEETGHLNDKVLVVYLPDCHESIAGIIAGRIKERYHKPVFVITKSEEGLKGSGRSIEAFSMYDEMSRIGDCFTKFGGHPMAAGLSMEEDRLEEFRSRINDNAALTEEDFVEKVSIDVPMPFSYLREDLIGEFACLEPYGTGNRAPLFAQKDLRLCGLRTFGKNGRVSGMRLVLEDGRRNRIDAVYFGDVDRFFDELESAFGISREEAIRYGIRKNVGLAVAYQPSINDFSGRPVIELKVKYFMLTPSPGTK